MKINLNLAFIIQHTIWESTNLKCFKISASLYINLKFCGRTGPNHLKNIVPFQWSMVWRLLFQLPEWFEERLLCICHGWVLHSLGCSSQRVAQVFSTGMFYQTNIYHLNMLTLACCVGSIIWPLPNVRTCVQQLPTPRDVALLTSTLTTCAVSCLAVPPWRHILGMESG